MEVISFVLKENNNASFEGVFFFLSRMKNGSQKQQRGSKTLNHAADLILAT
jgi:hypothetical protein